MLGTPDLAMIIQQKVNELQGSNSNDKTEKKEQSNSLLKNIIGGILQTLANPQYQQGLGYISQNIGNVASQQNNLANILQGIISYQQNKSPWLQGSETFLNSLAAGLLQSPNINERAFGAAMLSGGGMQTPEETIQDKLYKQATQTLQTLNNTLATQTKALQTGVSTVGIAQQEQWTEEFNPLKMKGLQNDLIKQQTELKYLDDMLDLKVRLLNEGLKQSKEKTKAMIFDNTLNPLRKEEFETKLKILKNNALFQPFKTMLALDKDAAYINYLRAGAKRMLELARKSSLETQALKSGSKSGIKLNQQYIYSHFKFCSELSKQYTMKGSVATANYLGFKETVENLKKQLENEDLSDKERETIKDKLLDAEAQASAYRHQMLIFNKEAKEWAKKAARSGGLVNSLLDFTAQGLGLVTTHDSTTTGLGTLFGEEE